LSYFAMVYPRGRRLMAPPMAPEGANPGQIRRGLKAAETRPHDGYDG